MQAEVEFYFMRLWKKNSDAEDRYVYLHALVITTLVTFILLPHSPLVHLPSPRNVEQTKSTTTLNIAIQKTNHSPASSPSPLRPMQFNKQLHIPQIIPTLTPPPNPIHRLPQTRRRIRKPKHHIFGRRPHAVVEIQTLRVRGVLDWTVWLGAGKLRT